MSKKISDFFKLKSASVSVGAGDKQSDDPGDDRSERNESEMMSSSSSDAVEADCENFATSSGEKGTDQCEPVMPMRESESTGNELKIPDCWTQVQYDTFLKQYTWIRRTVDGNLKCETCSEVKSLGVLWY